MLGVRSGRGRGWGGQREVRELGRQERALCVWCVMVDVFVFCVPYLTRETSCVYTRFPFLLLRPLLCLLLCLLPSPYSPNTKQTLFIEANPSPCKYAMSLRGECTDAVRLPLVPMGDDNKEIMRAAMEAQGYLA